MKYLFWTTVVVLFFLLAFSGLAAAQNGENNDSPVPVSGVTVTPESLEMLVGEVKYLTAEVSPASATNQNVEWDSNNKNVATVEANSDAAVTAVGAGTAVITVTTEDGDHTATATINVEALETGDDTTSEDRPTPSTGGFPTFHLVAGLLATGSAALVFKRFYLR
ncbi:MAG: Ig-like domain-containing protein [Bacillota bacterium]